LLSGIGLYTLAATGISAVGYVSSGATLLLTALRPAIRAYQYLAVRLSMIREQIKYPREDVVELRVRVSNLEANVAIIREKLDTEANIQQQEVKITRQELARLKALLEKLEAKNQVEHETLSQEAQNAIAQLTEDSQFLNHVREIIRFFKTA
jgi:BMFP domain-containing protein YqiC